MLDASLPPRIRLSGDDLRLLRLSRRVSATEMVPFYRAGRTAITNLEQTIRPRPSTIARYIEALALAEAERDDR